MAVPLPAPSQSPGCLSAQTVNVLRRSLPQTQSRPDTVRCGTVRDRIRHVQTGISDTDPDVLRLQVEFLRQATPARRVQLALSLSASVMQLAYAGIRRRLPGISDLDASLQFVEIHYGADVAKAIRARLAMEEHT